MENNLIFWNEDTQKDFMYEGWALPVPGAERIIPNLEKLTRFARENNYKVVNTGDWHTKDSREFSDNPDYVNTFPPHCLRNTEGAELIPETMPENSYIIDWTMESFDANKVQTNRNVVIYKDAFNVFDDVNGNLHTRNIVNLLNPNKVVVYGVATNVCVDYAVMGLLKMGKEVYAVTDAMKELPGMELPYEKWKAHGAKLVTTKNVLENKI